MLTFALVTVAGALTALPSEPALPKEHAIPLELTVGETVERGVGRAMGWFCDEPKFLSAKMVTRHNRNFWIVTGVAPGTTQCRIGPAAAETGTPTFLFAVTVTP